MMIKFEWDNHVGPLIYFRFRSNYYGLCLCHQSEERSFYFFGLEKYLCSRCLGILIGTIVGVFLHISNFNIPFLINLGFIIPLFIDGFTQLFDYRNSNNIIRFITGLIFGIGFYNMGLILNVN